MFFFLNLGLWDRTRYFRKIKEVNIGKTSGKDRKIVLSKSHKVFRRQIFEKSLVRYRTTLG